MNGEIIGIDASSGGIPGNTCTGTTGGTAPNTLTVDVKKSPVWLGHFRVSP